ncbi:hypothetical protein JCM19037_1844 [Geomicrobium sp. JCM 19037]|nr:hypothetical protein JCM19037_1844 [Geomicrobium sp. JCM 19037]
MPDIVSLSFLQPFKSPPAVFFVFATSYQLQKCITDKNLLNKDSYFQYFTRNRLQKANFFINDTIFGFEPTITLKTFYLLNVSWYGWKKKEG